MRTKTGQPQHPNEREMWLREGRKGLDSPPQRKERMSGESRNLPRIGCYLMHVRQILMFFLSGGYLTVNQTSVILWDLTGRGLSFLSTHGRITGEVTEDGTVIPFFLWDRSIVDSFQDIGFYLINSVLALFFFDVNDVDAYISWPLRDWSTCRQF